MGLMAVKRLKAMAPQVLGCAPDEVGVGWVAMRSTLLAQAERENESMIGCSNVHYISMFDSNPERHLDSYKAKVLVFDEAHHSAATTCVGLYNRIKPNKLLGLSATPLRTDKMDLCFQITVRDAGYHRLIQEGWLSKFDQYMIEGEFTPTSVAKAYLKDPHRWGQSVIFFLSEAECRACEAMLRAGGVRCETVTGSTDRERQIMEFEAGGLDVLLNMVVLSEGFDCAQIKTVWVRDTGNKSAVTQMAGRVLRLHPDLPVKQIVQGDRTRYPFTRVAAPRTQFVEIDGQWRTIGMNDLIKQVSSRVLTSMVKSSPVVLPKFFNGLEDGRKKVKTWEDPAVTAAKAARKAKMAREKAAKAAKAKKAAAKAAS